MPTPVNDVVLELGRQIGAGTRVMDPSNLDVLKSMIADTLNDRSRQ
jgi:hypothetical protein